MGNSGILGEERNSCVVVALEEEEGREAAGFFYSLLRFGYVAKLG
jgi:hypothetical protein